ncbi:hypothetical protein INT45_000339 [Circinella minor]|uniref:Tc1-like transposase DDE domain-containing protein n=1 Tax=Circinella minor TaxID=1195481 RepID=A0A8H7VAL3_9FUNG|nr:hypothetical protein INT45_000339 [Circinella minor]
MNLNNANTSDLTRIAVLDEDTDMEAANHEIDAEPSSYQVVCFPTDHTRLMQASDGIDNTTTDDSSSSSSSESDSNDEPQLVSILPDTPSLENPVSLHAVKKKKKQVQKPENPCGKYTPHSSDLMKQSLFLKLCGKSNKEISNILDVPEAMIRDHYNRHQNRDGNPEPIRQKRSSSSKITEAGSQFLVRTVTSANTLTLQQLQQQYFKKFDLLLAPSTIYCHLVNKCRITIKRPHPYPERRTDEVIKDRRVAFIKDYIHSGIVDYQRNCVFVDETPINGNMRCSYGWAAVNQAVHVYVPQMSYRSVSQD